MSLNTNTINDIVDDCDFYEDMITRPSYFRSWVEKPAFTYGFKKKCWELEQLRLTGHSIRKGGDIAKIYTYKNTKPRMSSSLEPFNREIVTFDPRIYNNFINMHFTKLLLIIFILLLLITKNNL